MSHHGPAIEPVAHHVITGAILAVNDIVQGKSITILFEGHHDVALVVPPLEGDQAVQAQFACEQEQEERPENPGPSVQPVGGCRDRVHGLGTRFMENLFFLLNRLTRNEA